MTTRGFKALVVAIAIGAGLPVPACGAGKPATPAAPARVQDLRGFSKPRVEVKYVVTDEGFWETEDGRFAIGVNIDPKTRGDYGYIVRQPGVTSRYDFRPMTTIDQAKGFVAGRYAR